MATLVPTAQVPVNTQAITGNAAASQATIVPSYEGIGDPMLTFENLIQAPKQGKTFFTHYQSATPVDYYPMTLTSPSVVFQWSTQNFTVPNQYYLQIPCEIALRVQRNGTNPTSAFQYPSPYLTTALPMFKDGIWPNGAWYQMFKQIVLKLGDNNLQTGFFPMGENNGPSALSTTQIFHNYFANEEIYDCVKMGTPWSQGLEAGAPYTEIAGGSNSVCTSSTSQNPEFQFYYGEYLKEIYNSVFMQNCGADGTLAGSANTDGVQTAIIPITVPLSLLRTWFQNDGIVPPNMNFRLEMLMNPNAVEIGRWRLSSTIDNATLTNNLTMTMSARPLWNVYANAQWKIIEYNYIPRANIMQQFNQYWMNQPLVWHNNELEYFDIPAFSTTNFNVEVSINTQMPRQLLLAVYRDAPFTGNDLPVGQKTGTMTNCFYTTYQNALTPGVVWSNILVTTSGNRDIKFTTDYSTSQFWGTQNHLKDCLSTAKSKLQCFQERVGYENRGIRHSLNHMFEGSYVIITLDPTQHQKLGETTMDPGATVIRLAASLTRMDGTPLGTNYKVRVYKTYDYQTSYGANKAVTQTQWPASVQSGGRPPAISATFNQVA